MAAPQFGAFGLGGAGSQSVHQAQSASSSYAGVQTPLGGFGTGLGFGTGGAHYQSSNAGLSTSNLYG